MRFRLVSWRMRNKDYNKKLNRIIKDYRLSKSSLIRNYRILNRVLKNSCSGRFRRMRRCR